MTWLVTGGAGYIGAHVVREFESAGIPVLAFDNLSSGHSEFVPATASLVRGDILDGEALLETMTKHRVTGIVHLAGFKYAGVSMQRPLHTYQQNVTGTAVLLAAAESAGVNNVVFSSSAAVYGTPDVDLVTETTVTRPESPYGESKLIGEWLLADQGRATGLRHTSLRYFNVVGSGSIDVPDLSPHNLFPLVFEALLAGKRPRINGDGYPTPDGTCVRDYIHVSDLAKAHVAAAVALQSDSALEPVYNLGSGQGVSVREIISMIARVTETEDNPEIGPPRPGDPARIVADGALAARDLDWRMRHDLSEMVGSAWAARNARQPRS